PSTIPVTSYTPPPSSPSISMPPRTSTPSPTSPPITHGGQPIQSHKRFSWGRALLVIGLVVLVVAGSVAYFSFPRTPQLVAIPNLPYKGYLALDDPLSDNSKGYRWS